LICDTELDLAAGTRNKTPAAARRDVDFMNRKDIRFLNLLSLRGPNIWTYRPVLEAWVDIGDLEECPSNTIPGFVERLCAWLPGLSEHRCSYGEAGGFVRRLQEGTWPAHILEHVTLELQNLAGMPGGFGRARETPVRGVYKVVVRSLHEDVSRACLHAARDLVMAAIGDTPFDLAVTHERLREIAVKHLPGPNTACIVDAATDRERGIPAIRLSADNLIQLGYGSRQRRIWAAQSDRTSAIAQGIAQDPELSARLLESCGLPVAAPAGDPVEPDGRRRYRLLVLGGALVAAARVDEGGAAVDVTGQVHPATATAACLAVRVIGLDIAGVDVLADDIARPLDAQGGAIAAVHEAPSLVTHLQPASGEPRPVGRAIVDYLFANGDTGRIPVVGITGSGGTTEVAHWLTEFLRLAGKFTGLACGDGLFLDRRRVESGDCGTWQCGTQVLMNRAVEAAVLENRAEVILGQGLAYDRCQVAVVTGIEPERHCGDYHIATPEQVFQVFRTQVDVVLPGGVAVLHAADPRVAEMASYCDGEVVFYASDADLPVLAAHRAQGGRAVCVRGDQLVLASAADESSLLPLADIPYLTGDHADIRLHSVLAAVAAAWALGIALHVIRTGATTYSDEPAQAPSLGFADSLLPITHTA
jgi:cyanophycin synthetase